MMSIPQLKVISNNLQEIYTAIKIEPGHNFNLTASGERLYCSQASWIGKVVSLVKETDSFFSKRDSNLEHVQTALRITEKLFGELQDPIKQKISATEQSFISWSQGIAGSAEIFDRESAEIEVINLAIRPFIKECIRSNPRLLALFESCFPCFAQNYTTTFQNSDLYEKLGRIARLRLLTTASLNSVPLHLIKKSMHKLPLTKEEVKIIKQWLKRIRRSHSCPTSRPLFKGLTSMASLWNQFKSPAEAQFSPFLSNCPSSMSDYIYQKDPKHMEWRRQLKPGDQLIDRERNAFVYLGVPLNNRPEEDDLNINFCIQDNSNMVITIAQNRGVLALRRYGRESNNPDLFGFHPARFNIISTNGSFALIEKLYPLNDPKPLIGQMKWLMGQLWSPTPLKLKYLMLNKDGVLCSVKTHMRKVFDFVQLEQIVFEFSKGDQDFYREIICESKMNKHPHAIFYSKLMNKALKNKDFTNELIITLANKMKIWDQTVLDHGKTLFEAIYKAAKLLKEDLTSSYIIENENKFDEILKKELVRFSKLYGIAGRMWDNFPEIIRTVIVRDHKLKKKL